MNIIADAWKQFVFVGELLVIGYLLHFVPFFCMDKTLFIYNYLPALLFKIILFPVVMDHIRSKILR